MTQDFSKEFDLFDTVGDLVKAVRDYVDDYNSGSDCTSNHYGEIFEILITRVEADMKAVELKYADIQ